MIRVLFGQEARDYSDAGRLRQELDQVTAQRTNFENAYLHVRKEFEAAAKQADELADENRVLAAKVEQMQKVWADSLRVGLVEEVEQTDPYEVTEGEPA